MADFVGTTGVQRRAAEAATQADGQAAAQPGGSPPAA